MDNLVPVERIENVIYLIRGQKVVLDFDLAVLYQVPTWRLNEQVKRNRERFPKDFLFSLTRQEIMRISQNAISLKAKKIKFSKNVNAFTEQGVAMLSSVLKSKRAIMVNIAIMRTFVRLRRLLETHKTLADKIAKLEGKYKLLNSDVKAIFNIIHQIVNPPVKPIQKIGFLVDQK